MDLEKSTSCHENSNEHEIDLLWERGWRRQRWRWWGFLPLIIGYKFIFVGYGWKQCLINDKRMVKKRKVPMVSPPPTRLTLVPMVLLTWERDDDWCKEWQIMFLHPREWCQIIFLAISVQRTLHNDAMFLLKDAEQFQRDRNNGGGWLYFLLSRKLFQRICTASFAGGEVCL